MTRRYECCTNEQRWGKGGLSYQDGRAETWTNVSTVSWRSWLVSPVKSDGDRCGSAASTDLHTAVWGCERLPGGGWPEFSSTQCLGGKLWRATWGFSQYHDTGGAFRIKYLCSTGPSLLISIPAEALCWTYGDQSPAYRTRYPSRVGRDTQALLLRRGVVLHLKPLLGVLAAGIHRTGHIW
jgi:hypothetical protein